MHLVYSSLMEKTIYKIQCTTSYIMAENKAFFDDILCLTDQ